MIMMDTPPSSEGGALLLATRVSFGLLAVIAAVQTMVVIHRMRKTPMPVFPKKKSSSSEHRRLHRHRRRQDQECYYYNSLFLFLARLGFLIILFGTMVDNIRLFLGTFSFSWPQEVWDAHPNASLANHLWISTNDRQGLTVLAWLYWICIFAHQTLTALSFYSVAQIFSVALSHITPTNKAWRRVAAASNNNPQQWFWSTSVLVVLLATMGIHGFCVGPLQGRLHLRAATSTFMLHAEVNHPVMHGLLTVVLWQCMMIAVGMILWVQDHGNHEHFAHIKHSRFAWINIVCFFLHAVAGPRTNWLPSNFAEQLAFGTLLWYDGIYNTTTTTTRKQNHEYYRVQVKLHKH